jgi:imidazolonepropionase-like amidohydrolase
MSVEVRDGRISWIGPAPEYKGNRTTIRVVDGRARVLVPGLMDCHVHYSSPGGPDWIARFEDPPPELSIRAVELAETSLRSGVTTARDVGAPNGVNIRLSRLAKAGEILAPNIRAAGSWIAHRGTYVSFVRHFDSNKELRDAIREQIEAGADLIKVALSPWNEGSKPENGPEIPFDEKYLAVAVEEAHRNNFKIACHANDPISCRIAAHGGVDSLEHGMFLRPEDLQAMSRNHTFLVPTMSVWDAMRYYARAEDWPEQRKKRADDLRRHSRMQLKGPLKQGSKSHLEQTREAVLPGMAESREKLS